MNSLWNAFLAFLFGGIAVFLFLNHRQTFDDEAKSDTNFDSAEAVDYAGQITHVIHENGWEGTKAPDRAWLIQFYTHHLNRLRLACREALAIWQFRNPNGREVSALLDFINRLTAATVYLRENPHEDPTQFEHLITEVALALK